MRVGFPGGPRLAWYDRNPQQGCASYHGMSIGPHSSTVRATYTVPTGKKAKIMGAIIQLIRDTAADPVGVVIGFINADMVWTNRVLSIKNASGDDVLMVASESGVLLEGNAATLNTIDGSTGGSCHYILDLNYIEFDA